MKNTKIELLECFLQTVRDFTDLSGTEEIKLDYEN